MEHFLNLILPSSLFTQPFMIHAFISGSIVAIVTGLVGFFVILRGSSFVAHVLPKAGFAGAAGSLLLSGNLFLGLSLFSVGGALSIGWLGRRGRHDVGTALTLIVTLGLGALFLSLNNDYATGAFGILFGQLVGVSANQVIQTAILGAICLGILGFLYRPLLFSSIMKSTAQARGIRIGWVDIGFLITIGLTTAVTVPIVGALLCFSLLIGPAAIARILGTRPWHVLLISVTLSVATIWLSLILGYDTGWPIGFFVSSITALTYVGTISVIKLTRTNE